ncbi:spore germination protein [Paenibacillus montanisoli]|uniref:Spore germination protein n=2 Tax=Paenibacillus montanisoli TaxID=2081970 RepID=A0A328U5V6_9BACL|nr:spore germination protein [Paenibacillus montanisoli]
MEKRAEQPELLGSDLQSNMDKVKAAFGNSSDIVTERISIAPGSHLEIGYIYTEGLVSSALVQNMMLESCESLRRWIDVFTEADEPNKLDLIRGILAPAGKMKDIIDFQSLYTSVMTGVTVLLIDGFSTGLAVCTQGGEDRSVEEPETQSVVRGPRVGFTENLNTNIALIRRRIKSTDLWLESMEIGKVTKTKVALMYVNSIASDKIVEEVRLRLSRIDIDGILESSYIEELIQDETFTVFPTLYNSERPDVVVSGLLEGRVAIFVDGTPFVLLAPALFVQFYQSAEDYYQRFEFATLIRLLRYICFFISLLAPSLYIAITTFHQELLPSQLLLSLAAQREGIPFPAFIEAVVMELTFEILREAGVRLPKTVGQAVSIVGALVIGQAAVEAGLVSPAMVIVVAVTAISNFVIPSFNMGISIRIIRFIMMLFAATFGLFGITVGLIAMVQHLCSLRSFGVPYMSPMAPLNMPDQKDTILRLPLWGLFSRPRFIGDKNKTREANPPTTKPNKK